MGLEDSVSWYQKKIGTYDKQQWEKTVEQRILHGLTHVMKKTAKLKTDLIDVDLVRGSSFPKAKPKHGLITVTRLAMIRWLFLPLYSYWWIEQTCFSIFSLLLLLYILQLCNMIVYFYKDQVFEHISTYEILVPAGMMLVLSIIHSQIVSTNNSSQNFSKSRSKRRKVKRRNFSFNKKAEIYSSKESISSVPSAKSRSTFKVDSVEVSSTRRKNIGWCIPLQNVTELKDSECNEELEEINGRKEIFENKAAAVEDDGFESLYSNGSSENGDENPENNGRNPIATDEEILEDRKLESPDEGKVEETPHGVLKCNSSRDTKEFSDCKSNFSNEINLENGCDLEEKSKVQEEQGILTDISFRRRHSASGLHTACEIFDHETDHKDTDSDASEKVRTKKSTSPQRLLQRRRSSMTIQAKALNSSHSSYYNSSCESDGGDQFDGRSLNEGATSATEWIGITTNSEECSITSEIEESDTPNESKVLDDHPFAWEFQLIVYTVIEASQTDDALAVIKGETSRMSSSNLSPSILSPSCASSDKVSCMIWENNDVKRADLSVLDISSAIIARVEAIRESMDYFYVGIFISVVISLLPSLRRLFEITQDSGKLAGDASFHTDSRMTLTTIDLTDIFYTKFRQIIVVLIDTAFGRTFLERFLILSAMFERLMLSALFFFLVTVAERTFRQRFLYAKFFSRLTSFRRARKSELPHFRLNKVRNIKTWLSVRSYLKKRGPQRSVDVIVSTAFIITLFLLSFLSVELLKDSMRLHSEYNLEAIVWCLVLGVYLLRFMTLGNKTNRKYRNLSVLLTEQINLYLQIEQKPHKKDELMVANSVLKLAADLLKELESPFKISGLSANPYVYTIIKVIILSALSGVLSELLGFKLKLHKIKIK